MILSTSSALMSSGTTTAMSRTTDGYFPIGRNSCSDSISARSFSISNSARTILPLDLTARVNSAESSPTTPIIRSSTATSATRFLGDAAMDRGEHCRNLLESPDAGNLFDQILLNREVPTVRRRDDRVEPLRFLRDRASEPLEDGNRRCLGDKSSHERRGSARGKGDGGAG